MKVEKEFTDKHRCNISRRNFLSGAAATAAFAIVPRHVLAQTGGVTPSEKINVGIIGVGGQGTGDMQELLEFTELQIVAIADPVKRCDYSKWWYKTDCGREPAREIVEQHYAEQKQSGVYKGCNTYADFREMLEKEKLDAVLVATTDNLHAPAAMAAMKKGLHVYCEKPLTHTIDEARQMANLAREKKLATQMGNAGQASEGTRRVAEFIADGAIGPVREVHDWTNRPVWPQGIDRPKDTPPVPEWIDWDLWLGPAPSRPYHPVYLPVAWRGWWDFGTGALGDMGCHTFDPIFRALKLQHPVSVEACYANQFPVDFSEYKPVETFPHASIVRYEFPARAEFPALNLTWYDGWLRPPRPAELEDKRIMAKSGVLYVGDKGKMLEGRIIPESKMQQYKQPPRTLPRSPGHYNEWVNAIKGGPPAGANFEFASLVTQVVLLGNIALRFPNTRLKWDGPNMKITNVPEANNYIQRQYRDGWNL